jgi:hypothetical protein
MTHVQQQTISALNIMLDKPLGLRDIIRTIELTTAANIPAEEKEAILDRAEQAIVEYNK